MTHRIAWTAVVLALGVSAAVASRQQPPPQSAPIIQPGAPGQPSREVGAAAASDLSRVRFTIADVVFMQGMIGHHLQALEMTDLLKTRTTNEDMRKLAQRIDVSQIDEVNMMKRWLMDRAQAVPDDHAMHQHGATLMPGMLTAEEMARLAAAKGRQFDRLFLEGMIKHHGGALTMVEALFASPGAAQESEVFAFASDVEADQRMEINRMGAMLNAVLKELQR
jgi:uncharacterized protein (DUF305 family)